MTSAVCCLVDGVGRPKLFEVQADPDLPLVVQFAHQGITRGPGCRVQFIRQMQEFDPDGHQVYRMRGAGAPDIRVEFLREAFNRPRLEP